MILTACSFSSNQIGPFTKSNFVSESEKKRVEKYFSSFTNWTFEDSIKVSFDVTKEANYHNIITISFSMPTDTIETQINRQGALLDPDDNIFIDVNKNTAFILWLSEPYYNSQNIDARHRFELYLKSVNIYNGKELFKKKIYSTKCCIDRVSMIYNPFTSSILISYNDFSKNDSKYLMYGFIRINGDGLPSNNFEPAEINNQDKSEKRFPHFIIDGQNIYLYHSSGDRWGFFEHSGKAEIGISNINKSNIPINYRLLVDSSSIETKLLLQNDTLYYRVRIENKDKPDEMRIKWTTIDNLEKF